ncbi:MAG: hypothetical protein AB7U30_04560 [Sulfuricellaceae bacterium]|jgi:hypothetical protein
MAMNGVGGGGASQIYQMLELNKQLNVQASQRSIQATEKVKATASAVIDLSIANQQRAVAAGNDSLSQLGKFINTKA